MFQPYKQVIMRLHKNEVVMCKMHIEMFKTEIATCDSSNS